MIGHIKPPLCRLPTDIRNNYKNLYCSICYSLRQQFGLTNSAFVNNELTLILLAFSDNFTGQTEQVHCPAHFFLTRKTISKHPIIDKAAQFSLILAWIKLIDSEVDNPSFFKTRLKNSVNKKVYSILLTLDHDTQQIVDNYIQLTKNTSANFDKVVEMSGVLARQVARDVAQKVDQPIDSLNIFLNIFELIGNIIAIADPLLDLEKDMKKQAFNPILAYSLHNNTEIKEEVIKFKQFYDTIENGINQQIQLLPKNAANTAFNKILFKSIFRLRRAIEKVMFPIVKNKDNQTETCLSCNCCNGNSCNCCRNCLGEISGESCEYICNLGCNCCRNCDDCNKCHCDGGICDCCNNCDGCDCGGCDCSC